MRTVHQFTQRVTYIKEGMPAVRNMEFVVQFDNLIESGSRAVKIQQFVAQNAFVFFDQPMHLDADSSIAKFEHFSMPYYGFGLEIVSQDLSRIGLVSDALSNHLSSYFSTRVSVYTVEECEGMNILRSMQVPVGNMRRITLFDFQNGILNGHEVVTDRQDVPDILYLERKFVFNADALCVSISDHTRALGMTPYYIEYVVNHAGAVDGQAFINDNVEC